MELIARNPYQLQNAHRQMMEWCDSKIAECEAEEKEYRQAIKIATERKWRVKPLQAKLNVSARRVTFYGKIKKALELGYLIVPNFDCTFFAVRTKRSVPTSYIQESQWSSNHQQSAQILPEGQGEYVSPDPVLSHAVDRHKDANGKEVVTHSWWPSEFKEVSFPFDLAKPAVMEPVASAMVTKLFDAIGIARNVRHGYATKRGDPIIMGIIKNPRTSRQDVAFFIAWAFNPDVL